MISLKKYSLPALLLCIFLTACGGGGGGGDSNASDNANADGLGGSPTTPSGGTSGGNGSPASPTSSETGSSIPTPSGEESPDETTVAASSSLIAGNQRGSGYADGTGTDAQFFAPLGIARDSGGNLIVADRLNHVIRKVTPDGVASTVAGTPGTSGYADGSGSAARFNSPWGVAVDSADNIYVTEFGSNAVRRITTAGVVSTFAGSATEAGLADGTGSAARFRNPREITVDSADNVFVTDYVPPAGFGPSAAYVRKITPSGEVSTFAGNLGGATFNTFYAPSGIAVGNDGTLYVLDLVSNIGNSGGGSGYYILYAFPQSGQGSILAGSRSPGSNDRDGVGTQGIFRFAGGLSIEQSGGLLLSSESGIRRVGPDGTVTTVSRNSTWPTGFGVSRLSTAPEGVYATTSFGVGRIGLDGSGAAFLAGQLPDPGTADGVGAAAKFRSPKGIAVDASGNLLVADTDNMLIRKVTSAGAVSTLPAELDLWPFGMTFDSAGNLYAVIFDTKIVKIGPDGVATPFVGHTYTEDDNDGTGSAAGLRGMLGIVADSEDNLFVAQDNGLIRKITPAGVVSTLPIATFAALSGAIGIDQDDNLYVVDGTEIKKITPAGAVSVLGSWSTAQGETSTGGPESIAVSAQGDVYISDTPNNAILKLTQDGSLSRLDIPQLFRPKWIAFTGPNTMAVTVDHGVLRIVLP